MTDQRDIDRTIAISDANERFIYACVGGDEAEIAEARAAMKAAREMSGSPPSPEALRRMRTWANE